MPLAFGPSECISTIEKLAIRLGGSQHVELANVRGGGEHVGQDYHCFLYFAHNHAAEFSLAHNCLWRFSKPTCFCEEERASAMERRAESSDIEM